MSFQTVFKRYEIKFLISGEQREALIAEMRRHMMKPDRYGHSTICNLYYDTDNYRLARRSEEKPVYKEKLRLRSYGRAEPNSIVFAELKKKYHSVVYKRRLALPESEASEWLRGGASPRIHTQIEQEIEYFLEYYGTLEPRLFLSYEREAFFDSGGSDFRVTLDENLLARTDRLSLCEKPGGMPLLDPRQVIMELKTSGALPLWMTSFLTSNRIFKASFSKYGAAYRNIMLNDKGERQYVC